MTPKRCVPALQLAFAGLPEYNLAMQESGKKAYEIGYALFRLAAKAHNNAFREILEKEAFKLLDAVINADGVQANNSAKSIESIMRFSSDVGIIHPANAETVIAELRNFHPAIAEIRNSAKTEAVDLSDIFAGQEPLFSGRIIRTQEPVMEDNIEINESPVRSEIRQSAILERIRQSGNCRLKDIQEILPDTSERTIRYDLQSLVERNLVEKVGTGGPSVFYRVRGDAS